MATALKNPIGQRILKKQKSRSGKTVFSKKQIGFIVAGIVDSDVVAIGYSLCHKNDTYDHIDGVRKPGWGKNLAATRAQKWSSQTTIEVPPSIAREVRKFVQRCEKYYKGMEIQDINEQPVEYPASS